MKKYENIEKDKLSVEENEIDLVEIAKTIWEKRKIIYRVVAIFVSVGLIVAFGSKVEYEASCKLLADNQGGSIPNLGGLGGLAGLAGINLDMNAQGTLSPKLYPQIVQSMPFQLKAIKKELTFEKEDTTISSYLYFKDIDSPSFLGLIADYTVKLPWKIKDLLSTNAENENGIQEDFDRLIRLSKEDSKLIDKFRERIDIDVDSETGVISLNVEMPDPMAAAELTKICVNLLQEYIINYRISKARENLDFIKERCQEAKNKFEVAQERLASFDDRNANVVTASAQTERQRLQNEYNLAFEIYQGLAQQLEQAKIKVKENTPVFTVVEPVKIPSEKSQPNRVLIIFIFIFLSFFFGILYIMIKHFISRVKNSSISES